MTGIGKIREVEVLAGIRATLPGGYEVFDNVAWSSVYDEVQWFGEIDAIVLAPGNHLVLLEIKAGPVELSESGLHKRYADQVKDVGRQTRHQYSAIRSRLKEAGFSGVYVAQLLVLPDARVESGTVAYPRERIVDTTALKWLAERIVAATPVAAPAAVDRERLRRFLLNLFDLAFDPTARIGLVSAAVAKLAEGLATWVPKIHSPSGQVCVEATAGSGKTQLALRLLNDAADAGLRARYVCFNRPLARHMRARCPQGVDVATFHELAIAALQRKAGSPPDFDDDAVFQKAEDALLQDAASAPEPLDLLVVDESQDLKPEWLEALAAALVDRGRLYVLRDDDQSLYDRVGFDLPDATVISCRDNFRSPRAVVRAINALGLIPDPVIARAPIDGAMPGFHEYDPAFDPGGVAMTEGVVRTLLEEGVPPEQIAVVTFCGQRRSLLLKRDAIAAQPLRKFRGTHDSAGTPQWSDGPLLAETVFRFKGQAAPVIVLAEIDFDDLDEGARRRLFVGFTRAQLRLECIVSTAAMKALARRLDAVDDSSG